MKILVIGRTLPQSHTGSFGLFEFQQAKALGNYSDTGYLFIENSSLLSTRKIKYVNMFHEEVPTVGFYLPIKGLPKSIFHKIRTYLFLRAFQKFTETYFRPDVVHVHFPLLTLNNEILAFFKKMNIKLVVTEHWTKVQKKELSKSNIRLLRAVVEQASSVVCVGEDLKQSINELTNNERDDLKVIPNMISEVFFEQEYNDSGLENAFHFTYIGRLTKTKRLDLLVGAFKKAFEKHPKVKLLIIGDGPTRRAIEKQIGQRWKDRILMKGNQPKEKVAEYLKNTAVYVSASNFETFGVPFIEAMAMGIPIIAADNLPVRAYVSSSNGVLFKVDSASDLRNQLQYMYENRAQYQSEKIKANMQSLFSPKSVAKQLLKLYEGVLRG